MNDGKSDELFVYKYYLDRGHSFKEMNDWTYDEYVLALSFILYEVDKK